MRCLKVGKCLGISIGSPRQTLNPSNMEVVMIWVETRHVGGLSFSVAAFSSFKTAMHPFHRPQSLAEELLTAAS